MSLPGRCNLGARHVPGHRDVDDDDDSDNDNYDGAGVGDDDDNCANLRSVDRFVGALRNVQRTCSYSSLRTLIILIIVHAIMMIIKVITIVIVIMRAKTIRIACVQRIAPSPPWGH